MRLIRCFHQDIQYNLTAKQTKTNLKSEIKEAAKNVLFLMGRAIEALPPPSELNGRQNFFFLKKVFKS